MTQIVLMDEEFPVFTPYGPATCFAVFPNSDCEWATFNEATQELWWFQNKHIRRRISATNARRAYSPFVQLNPIHIRHIKRYVASKYLPENYDPSDVETWPL